MCPSARQKSASVADVVAVRSAFRLQPMASDAGGVPSHLHRRLTRAARTAARRLHHRAGPAQLRGEHQRQARHHRHVGRAALRPPAHLNPADRLTTQHRLEHVGRRAHLAKRRAYLALDLGRGRVTWLRVETLVQLVQPAFWPRRLSPERCGLRAAIRRGLSGLRLCRFGRTTTDARCPDSRSAA
jgi:hypothetical protein